MISRTLVTGATGYLGRRLVRGLLARGETVTAPVRAADDETARARLLKVLGHGCDRPTLQVIAADVASPLPLGRIVDAGPFDRVWHLAALLDLGTRRTADLVATNVGGTRAVLDAARSAGCGWFHYVGTAYACGVSGRSVPEGELPRPTAFHNVYEQTKFDAEALVRDAMKHGLRGTVHRPSIVVGDSFYGRTDVFGAFYAVVRACALASTHGEFVLPAAVDSRLDLVPVDRVVAAMLALSLDERAAGGTFHLTNPSPPTMGEVVRAARDALGLRIVDVRLGRPEEFPPLTRAVFGGGNPMLPYLHDGPVFERGGTDDLLGPDFLRPRIVGGRWLRKLMRFGVRCGFGVDEETRAHQTGLLARRLSRRRGIAV